MISNAAANSSQQQKHPITYTGEHSNSSKSNGSKEPAAKQAKSTLFAAYNKRRQETEQRLHTIQSVIPLSPVTVRTTFVEKWTLLLLEHLEKMHGSRHAMLITTMLCSPCWKNFFTFQLCLHQ